MLSKSPPLHQDELLKQLVQADEAASRSLFSISLLSRASSSV